MLDKMNHTNIAEDLLDRIQEALEHAETEMRYAGFDTENKENILRKVAYDKVKNVLEEMK